MIITCGGQKGGSGKSCLAQNLAVALANAGKPVMLIDADPQKTSSDWADERAKTEAVQIEHQAMSGDISKTVLTLAGTGRYLVIDCGGRDTKELRSAMIASDLLLVPVRPKRRDLKTLDYVSDLVEKSRIANPYLVARSVISQAPTLPSQVQRILDAKAVCESFDLPALPAVIFTRNVYDDAEEAGLSVFESDDEKARAEIDQICAAVLEIGQSFFSNENP
jgi:chromosome partitioning protein